jgi:hypothetical protein
VSELEQALDIVANTESTADGWISHDEAEARGLCPQRTDGFNYWREHDPSCNMHARWAMHWARNPEAMRAQDPRR